MEAEVQFLVGDLSLGQTLNDTIIPYGLVVRMLPFQGGGRGSIPRRGFRAEERIINTISPS